MNHNMIHLRDVYNLFKGNRSTSTINADVDSVCVTNGEFEYLKKKKIQFIWFVFEMHLNFILFHLSATIN